MNTKEGYAQFREDGLELARLYFSSGDIQGCGIELKRLAEFLAKKQLPIPAEVELLASACLTKIAQEVGHEPSA